MKIHLKRTTVVGDGATRMYSAKYSRAQEHIDNAGAWQEGGGREEGEMLEWTKTKP